MDPPFLSLLFYTVKEISFHLCPGSYSTLHSQENLIYDSLFNALSLSLSVDAETSTEVQVSPNLHKKNKKCLSDNHFLQVSDKFQNVYTVSISSSALINLDCFHHSTRTVLAWCWEGLGAGREGDDRGRDGWMASLTQWTWVWVNSGRWWTGRPGVLQSMGSQRVGHDWATELNWNKIYF